MSMCACGAEVCNASCGNHPLGTSSHRLGLLGVLGDLLRLFGDLTCCQLHICETELSAELPAALRMACMSNADEEGCGGLGFWVGYRSESSSASICIFVRSVSFCAPKPREVSATNQWRIYIIYIYAHIPPQAHRIWGMWGSDYRTSKAISYLLKGDYNTWQRRYRNSSGCRAQKTLLEDAFSAGKQSAIIVIVTTIILTIKITRRTYIYIYIYMVPPPPPKNLPFICSSNMYSSYP